MTLCWRCRFAGLYNEPSPALKHKQVKDGLIAMSREAARMTPLITPRRRATVLVIGNHSAGKSSFINHYVGEVVQSTGVAVETTGFTIVRSGLHEQEVRGEAALTDNEHIAMVADRLGGDDERRQFVEHLTMRVLTSRARQFESIDFIDTPGLCDGDVRYPFDVNRCIIELADVADLILVFLDPMGKAHVSRTIEVIRTLNIKHRKHHIMKFYITKADTSKNMQDLTTVVAQIAQSLAPHVYNTHGFKAPPMWVPQDDAANGLHGQSEAALERRGFFARDNGLINVMSDIARTVNLKIMDNLTKTTKDCRAVLEAIDRELAQDRLNTKIKHRWTRWRASFFIVVFLCFVLSLVDIVHTAHPDLPAYLSDTAPVQSLVEVSRPVVIVFTRLAALVGFTTLWNRFAALSVVSLVAYTLISFLKWRSSSLKTRSEAETETLKKCQRDVELMRLYADELRGEYTRAFQMPEYQFPTHTAAPGVGLGGVRGKGASALAGAGSGHEEGDGVTASSSSGVRQVSGAASSSSFVSRSRSHHSVSAATTPSSATGASSFDSLRIEGTRLLPGKISASSTRNSSPSANARAGSAASMGGRGSTDAFGVHPQEEEEEEQDAEEEETGSDSGAESETLLDHEDGPASTDAFSSNGSASASASGSHAGGKHGARGLQIATTPGGAHDD